MIRNLPPDEHPAKEIDEQREDHHRDYSDPEKHGPAPPDQDSVGDRGDQEQCAHSHDHPDHGAAAKLDCAARTPGSPVGLGLAKKAAI